ncbi:MULTISPECIES: hypothetical protein [Methylobacterium]|jgi:hypothetical protein|uniref:Uncharacterized protein n=1 Tax=Methylobacterium longum TaxID=767694 RepID=A0ABT8ATJ8_9HYPH|nr:MULTISPECIES: hypothetical protein [Methylobacterium]MCJ2102213.1 hypothetical protein [Methylobacterium sp. E-046]MDN3573171.1 hypothetical protein [Methylobacterium longum]
MRLDRASRERADLAQLDPIAIRQSLSDAVENRPDHRVDFQRGVVRVLRGDANFRLGADRARAMPRHSLNRSRAVAS